MNLLSLPSCLRLLPGLGAGERLWYGTGAKEDVPQVWSGMPAPRCLCALAMHGSGCLGEEDICLMTQWSLLHWTRKGLKELQDTVGVFRSAPQLPFGRIFGRLLCSSNISVAGGKPRSIGLTLHKDGKQTRETGMHRSIPSGLCLFLFHSLQLSLKVLTYF